MRTNPLFKLLLVNSFLLYSAAAHSTTGISALDGLEYICVLAMALGFLPIFIAFVLVPRFGFASLIVQVTLVPAYLILFFGVIFGAAFLGESHLAGAGAWMLVVGTAQLLAIVLIKVFEDKFELQNKSPDSIEAAEASQIDESTQHRD